MADCGSSIFTSKSSKQLSVYEHTVIFVSLLPKYDCCCYQWDVHRQAVTAITLIELYILRNYTLSAVL